MSKIAIAIHGGAGPDSSFIREHLAGIEAGLKQALHAGYQVLEKNGSALDAVEAAVNILEDDPLFNAGKGSALNNKGGIEMDASIMDGRSLNAGAAAGIQGVKNPVSLARAIMERTPHVMLFGTEASQLARRWELPMHSTDYFITRHQREVYQKSIEESEGLSAMPSSHGTVGAVALDAEGNLAAATSTGGTEGRMPGRVSDSCIIGAGCYANNGTCAVSGTGDGEVLITRVAAHTISSYLEMLRTPVQQACDFMVHHHVGIGRGDIGTICIDNTGGFGISFNSERMPRAWKASDGTSGVAIYP